MDSLSWIKMNKHVYFCLVLMNAGLWKEVHMGKTRKTIFIYLVYLKGPSIEGHYMRHYYKYMEVVIKQM